MEGRKRVGEGFFIFKEKKCTCKIKWSKKRENLRGRKGPVRGSGRQSTKGPPQQERFPEWGEREGQAQ